jgi:hypothetical protein
MCVLSVWEEKNEFDRRDGWSSCAKTNEKLQNRDMIYGFAYNSSVLNLVQTQTRNAYETVKSGTLVIGYQDEQWMARDTKAIIVSLVSFSHASILFADFSANRFIGPIYLAPLLIRKYQQFFVSFGLSVFHSLIPTFIKNTPNHATAYLL